MEEKRDTVGKISLELQEKSIQDDHTAREQADEQLKDFEDNIQQCVERCKQDYIGDFYVIVITKKERLMKNVLRNYFTGRQTCPTPEYDQTVYRYNRKAGNIEFLWVIPAKDVCAYMITNALELPPEQRELLEFVMDFTDGTLLNLAKKLNGEEKDTPFLIRE